MKHQFSGCIRNLKPGKRMKNLNGTNKLKWEEKKQKRCTALICSCSRQQHKFGGKENWNKTSPKRETEKRKRKNHRFEDTQIIVHYNSWINCMCFLDYSCNLRYNLPGNMIISELAEICSRKMCTNMHLDCAPQNNNWFHALHKEVATKECCKIKCNEINCSEKKWQPVINTSYDYVERISNLTNKMCKRCTQKIIRIWRNKR